MGWFSKVGTFIKNNAHTILDVAGMIPGVGAVADLANAALYAAEGDWANAAMSAVSAVPGIGDTIAMANKGMKAAKGVKTALKAGKSLKSIVKAGGKSVLKAIKGKAKAGAKAVKNWKETLGSIFKKKKTGDKHICTNGKCFTGDTLVCTNKGKVPIQEIRAGDLVYSRNEDTGEMGFQKVKEVFRTETHTIHGIEVNGEMTIQTTAYHPFYVEEKGWVSAINLQKGDCLLTPEGLAEVTGTRKERFEEPVTMYNFHVEEWVSYFVSELNLYVHNGNGHGRNSKANIEDTTPYSNLKDSKYVDDGKKFTTSQKKKIIQENMERNGGEIKSDLSGEVLVPAKQSQKGVTPNELEVQIDHIYPRSKGGSNSYSNAQVLSRKENILKSDKLGAK